MKIFVSHSRYDNNTVEKLIEKFKEYGIDYWVDLEQLDNDRVIEKINEGFENATHFLLVWSKNAKESDWVKEETNAASSKDYKDKLQIFSFKLDATSLLALIFSNRKLFEINKKNIDAQIENFIKSLDGLEIETQARIFKKQICNDYENYPEKSKISSYVPIIKDFKKFNGHKLYISQSYDFVTHERGYDYSEDAIQFCIDSILEFNLKNRPNDANNDDEYKYNTLLIVGEYGNGKSGLCHKMTYLLSKEKQFESKFPIYIPLGSINKINDESEISSEIFKTEFYDYVTKTYNLQITGDMFYTCINEGKIIFILDALDELSDRPDSLIAQKALNELIQLSIESTLIITSRHTYIQDGIPKNLVDYNNAIKINDFDDNEAEKFPTMFGCISW